MAYISPINHEHAEPRLAKLLNGIRSQLGMVPNLYATLARAPSALEALLEQTRAIASGSLSSEEREVVALAVAQANGCGYCLSAHTLLAKKAGLTSEQTSLARAGRGATPRMDAIAAFALELVENRGHVSEDRLDAFKSTGLSESELLEIVANVANSVFTNFANNIARTDIDFPVVDTKVAA